MSRAARFALAAVVSLSVACELDRGISPKPPSFAISDGARDGGNTGFFFLPPISNPGGDQDFGDAPFNPNLAPIVQICEGTGATGTECDGTEIAEFTRTSGPGSEIVRLGGDHYVVNWHTTDFDLNPALVYRIRVIVAKTVLGFADIEVGANRAELKNVDTQQFVPLVDGRTLPIKFRIEDNASCFGVERCTEEVIDLAQGGSVISETGDRVDIPAQETLTRVITVTLKECAGIDVDLQTFGRCLTVTADPPLGSDRLNPPATVSVCTLLTDDIVLPAHPQDKLLTLHRRDNGDVFALPHGEQLCITEEPIGAGPASPFTRLVRALGNLFTPQPLHAAAAVLDVGPSGETGFFSDFQLALPAQINIDGEGGFGDQPVGTELTARVKVTDVQGFPVANQTVRFNHTPPTGGGGGVTGDPEQCTEGGEGDPDDLICTTDENGIVEVSWTLGDDPGLNQLAANARGLGLDADLDGGGPFDSCVPAPETESVHCTGTEDVTLDLSAGSVTFTATGTSDAIDGVLGAAEWEGATVVDFDASLPEDRTVPAKLFIRNDATNLYLAVQFDRQVLDEGTQVVFEFARNVDGPQQNGDDVFLFGTDNEFVDDFRTNIPPCDEGSAEASCGFRDTEHDGTNDGLGAFLQVGTVLTLELSHPLDSGDEGRDFALLAGDRIGMQLILFVSATSDGVRFSAETRVPSGFGSFTPITITGP